MKTIILSGGSGTRLWPLSRKLMPKQFLKLFDGKSLFQKTVERNKEISNDLMVITNEDQYFLALDQLEELNNKFTPQNTKFLLEEIGKNTAPAIAFAAFESDEEDVLFITLSDHLIKNQEKYKKAINRAKELAKKGYLVTFGITPAEPHTGYGYIEAKGEDVIRFHEKPDLKTAKEYVKAGNYYWNSGMFMFKAGVYLEELKRYSPEVYESCLEVYKNYIKLITDNQLRITNMQDIPDISIDYAVIEKSDKIKVIPSNFEWNDVGSFDSLVEETNSKEAIDSKDNFYYCDNENKVIAAIGLEEYIVIDTKDALLITKKGQTQKVKEIVNRLKKENKELIESHVIVRRPWGTYETLIDEAIELLEQENVDVIISKWEVNYSSLWINTLSKNFEFVKTLMEKIK